MKWIELHRDSSLSDDLTRITINIDKIVAFETGRIITDSGHYIDIKESYETIQNLIENYKTVL